MIQERILPAGVSLDLGESVDVAMDHLGLPFFDWQVLVKGALDAPWLMRLAPHLAKTSLGGKLLVKRLNTFKEHTVVILRSFIFAHERVQTELKDTLTRIDAAIYLREVTQVVAESKLAVGEARRYLHKFVQAAEGESGNGLSLVESVRAWQLASKLTGKLSHHVHKMVSYGILSPDEAKQHLLDEVEEDEVCARTGIADTSGLSDPQAALATFQKLIAQRVQVITAAPVLTARLCANGMGPTSRLCQSAIGRALLCVQ